MGDWAERWLVLGCRSRPWHPSAQSSELEPKPAPDRRQPVPFVPQAVALPGHTVTIGDQAVASGLEADPLLVETIALLLEPISLLGQTLDSLGPLLGALAPRRDVLRQVSRLPLGGDTLGALVSERLFELSPGFIVGHPGHANRVPIRPYSLP